MADLLMRWQWGGSRWRAGLFFWVLCAPFYFVLMSPHRESLAHRTFETLFMVAVGIPMAAWWLPRQNPALWELDPADRVRVMCSLRKGECPDDVRLAWAALATMDTWWGKADSYWSRWILATIAVALWGWAWWHASNGHLLPAVTLLLMGCPLAFMAIRLSASSVEASRRKIDQAREAAWSVIGISSTTDR